MRKIILILFFAGTAVAAKAQLFTRNYDAGYYYDNTGTKVNGAIKGEESAIWFKKPKSTGEKSIPATDTKGYVIGRDSFIVSRNPGFRKPPFLRVVLDNPTKIYFFKADEKISFEPAAASAQGFAMGKGKLHSKYYFYGPSPDALTLLTSQNFISVMSDIMSDKPEIVERVKDKTINIKNIEEWVLFYKREKIAYPVAPVNK